MGIVPYGKLSAEGGVVEVRGLEYPRSRFVHYASKLPRPVSCVMAGDILPGIKDGYALVGARVGDRGLVERESGAFGGRKWMCVLVLAVFTVKVEIHLSVQCC